MLGQTGPISGRFEALDALRGICALLVVLFHIPIYHALKDVGAFANLQFCVDLFFALSGFVLCHAYGQRLNHGAEGLRFAVTRLARLWPLHLTILALFVGFELAKLIFSRADTAFELRAQAFAQGHSLWELVTNVLFLQSFGLHWGLSWNGPAWSAALEFYVSILFAVVVLLFPRRKYDVFLGLCVAAGLLLYTVSPDTLFVSYDWGMLRACFSFFAGCLVYDLRLRSGDRLKAPDLLEAGCLVLVVAFAVTTPSGGWQFAFPLAAMILIYVFSFDQGAISTVLRSSALQKLGLWSYSIYMIHTFIFHVMKMGASFIAQKARLDLIIWHNDEKLMLLGTPDQALLPALILSVVLVVPVAALTYRWIEKPAMDAARRGFSATSRPAFGFAGPSRWLRAISARRVVPNQLPA
ncbi:MAG: acyltransferase [Bradyrhizobium sp.]|uniref:acyltransferase family protein n=1 Tax=Bradyrhizobium sp. TaxID=376 RepID=UPI0027170189|nr:acyltransferase [Bradyrhizobium sp.]MDO8401625.1 acyltransferase [Bradyrhizobium sp.]